VSVLEVENLTVSIGPANAPIDLVSAASLTLESGKILGLVGESGCGKSMTSIAIMGLLAEDGPWLRSGRILIEGRDAAGMPPYRRVDRGIGGVAMIFQEPMTSLNPVLRIGEQIGEAIRVHDKAGDVDARIEELLRLVRLPDARQQMHAFPHELSGGMRQRVMIAIALACRPKVLIADEPTTALDVTVQLQILSLLRELCDSLGMAMLFITHDLGVVAQLADEVAVMYAGRIVEQAPVAEIFAHPSHPYTIALRDCIPDPLVHRERLIAIDGQAPGPGEMGEGCAFRTRCSRAQEDCRLPPPQRAVASNHFALCHHLLPAGAQT
jgi:peptide/nickel transport system ATP-binding protein